jgi:cytoskeleton protein RodZ
MIDRVESSALPADSGMPDARGAGALLKQAREAAGMHVGALAVTLKVPVHRLEALEAERWDLLPDPVFVRALAGSVCRVLKVDSAPVLEKLPSPARQPVAPDSGLNAPFRGASGPGAGTAMAAQLSRPLVLAVLALLLGVVGLMFLPSLQRLAARPAAEAEPAAAALPSPSEKAGSGGVVSTPAPVPIQEAPALAASATLPPSATQSVSPLAQAPQAVASSETGPADSGRSAEMAGKASAEPVIVFSTKGPSWIQVTDARGTVALKKELAAGETVGVSGVLPLNVVVGRVDVTTVEVRGKLKDLAPLAQNNVARFEVKE